MDWGFTLNWVEQTTQSRTEGGTLRSDGFEPYRRIKIALNALSASDRPKFTEWARKAGLRLDCFISAFPLDATALERDHSMAAKLVASPDVAGDFLNNFRGDFILEES